MALSMNLLVFMICSIISCFAMSLSYSISNTEYVAFVFGDSLVDAGNNDYLFTLSKADSPPYGIDFSPSGGHPTGRFTNGKTISDIVGEQLGAKSFPPPYLAPSTHGTAILGGVNYASGAAGILNDTGSIFIGRLSLDRQIDYFEDTKEELVKMLGDKNAEEFLGKALFSITVGANDFLNNFLNPISPKRPSPHSFEESMIAQYRLQIERLYDLGARKFVIAAVGPIGCIPYDRAINFLPNRSCSASSNELVTAYNQLLRNLISELNTRLSGAKLIYANSYDIVLDMFQNYANYGFENADDSCCGDVSALVPCSLKSNMCHDRSKYLFWDAYHPTEAANIIIGKLFLDGNLSCVYPMNIRQLLLL
ncbi:hypothetical protein SUGI_0493010 [Cryptomeria japonica]|uniref:GDSL esterase/lipase At3g50400 n=1 Tax=Cryptomeria japonica TaxID=3369 RepID=UPI002408BD61|nr:GDSL esterase/lipase At3g50400 [Cryptomeria japonica]GLJ25748.1 hypothetical protein SUGI_0493010 [Cryptomeria japonica]